MKKQLERYARKAVIAKPENRIDKLRQYMLQDHVNLLPHDSLIVLSPEEQRMLNILDEAFALLIDNSELEARKLMQTRHSVSSWQARNYITSAKELFGLSESLDKVTARFIQIERFESIIKEVKDDSTLKGDQKFDLIIKCQQEINKLKRLFDDDAIDPKALARELQIPVPVRTTDPKALELDAEDAEVIE